MTPQPLARIIGLSTAVMALVAASVACSGSDDTSSVPIDVDSSGEPTSPASNEGPEYTIVAGDTLSGIALSAGVTIDALVAANGWPDGPNHLLLPGDVISLPPGSSATQTPTVASDAPASSAAAQPPAAVSGGYASTSPSLSFTNDRTAAITQPLADGVYFARNISASGSDVSFELGQLFLCTGEPIADQPSLDCAGQTTVQLNQPSAQVQLAGDALVILISGGTGEPVHYSVAAAEYARLVSGMAPSSDVPAGFQFGGDRTLVRVSGGSVVTVEQIYTS